MKTIQSLQKKQRLRLDWILALTVTAAAVFLHLVFLKDTGGLWRDEAGVVKLATLPAFSETWKYLGHESCPLFFPAVIRFWSDIGLGGTDFGLRLYGLIVGLLLLGAVWFNAWTLTRSVPLISLGLLAANIAVVRWGDSLRAYGTGSFLMLLTLAFMWRFVAAPSRGRWLLALLAALAGVQCIFQNAFLLLAVCIAGGAVCWRRNEMKNVAAVFAIGLLAALSLVPYLRIIHEAKDWSVLSQSGFSPGLVWQNLSDAFALAAPWTKWLWLSLGLLAVFRWSKLFGRDESAKDSRENSAAFFAATALIAGTLIFFVYLRLAHLPTQVWYYLPLVTFAAVCLDAALTNFFSRCQIGRWLFVCLVVALPFAKTLATVQCRQTNIDLIAAVLRAQAGPDDLILVHPWYYGISFERYANGKTPWLTIPDLADHRFHRYDLFKLKMQMENPLQPELDRIAATLQSGHRVWIIGWLPFARTPPPDLGTAPNQFTGWLDEPYSQAWGESAGYLVSAHVEQVKAIPVASSNCVSDFENLPLVMVAGWLVSSSTKTSR
jgi:hypothetical protein